MSDRAMKGLVPPPSTRAELEHMLREINRSPDPTPEQLESFTKQVEQLFPGGFDLRDEANAIVAMAFRNGPLENLHAGNWSPLLDDDAVSRITDAEINALMLFAAQTVAMLLFLRDNAPEAYLQYVKAYATRYCRSWDRSS